ncbi:hypothetical protein QW71_34970 [Paenibacillus sp. IHB B 3415]|nr:hypothetical protein QW71_34970 [Paenibacillus sp. IHB B 3415]
MTETASRRRVYRGVCSAPALLKAGYLQMPEQYSPNSLVVRVHPQQNASGIRAIFFGFMGN